MLRQNIEVTQDKKLVNPAIHVVQGDTGRTVVALVKDATISGTATMAFERPDGTTYTTTATVNSDNSVEATFTADMLRVAGTGKATFKIVSSGSQVSTYQLYVLVEPSAGFERPVTPSNNKIYVYVNGSPVEVATAAEVLSKASQSQVDGISATVNNLVGRIVEDESNIAINTATLSNITPKVTKNESDISELKDDLTEINNRFISDGSEFNMINRILKNGYINNTNGNVVAYNNWDYTDFISVEPNEKYSFLYFNTETGLNEIRSNYYAWYDEHKQFISGGSSNLYNTESPAQAKFVRLSWSKTSAVSRPTLAKSIMLNGFNQSSDLMPPFKVAPSDIVKTNDGYTFEIPLYYETHVKAKIEKINELEMESGLNGATYAFITDMHANVNNMLSIPLLERIRANTNAYHCFYGGDSCRAFGTLDDLRIDNEKIMSGLYRVFGSDLSYVLGNHDYTICTGETWGEDMESISTNACYAIYDKKTKVDTKRLYFYWDDTENNIRHIIIDYTLVKAPWFLSWLKEAIASAPANCTFCFYSHINVFKPDGSINNEVDYSHIVDWLSALKNKTTYTRTVTFGTFTHTINVDYTNSTYDVAYFLTGHWHADYSKKVDGVNYIVTTSDACYNDDPNVTRERGNYREQAFDVIHINTSTKSIKFVRIGAGLNRDFTY